MCWSLLEQSGSEACEAWKALQQGRTKAKVTRQLAVEVRRRVRARQPDRRLRTSPPASSADDHGCAACALRHLSEARIKVQCKTLTPMLSLCEGLRSS